MKRFTLVCCAALAFAAFTLPAANPGSPAHFQVKVLDTAGQPIAGASVERYTSSQALPGLGGDEEVRLDERITTGANGIAAFTVTNRISLVVLVRKPGLSLTWVMYSQASFALQGGAELDDQVFEVTLAPPKSVSGIVRDQAGKPVSGVLVSVGLAGLPDQEEAPSSWAVLTPSLARQCFSARSDAEGKFSIEGLPPGATFELSASKPGLALEAAPSNLMDPQRMSYHAGQSDVGLTLAPGGAVEGRVVQEGSETPIAGARVSIVPNQQVGYNVAWDSALSGTDGTFHLAGLPPGSYVVRATETNPFPAWVCDPTEVTVEAGNTNRDVKLSASRGGVVEVTVRDDSKGQPVPEASVLAVMQSGLRTDIKSAITSSDGVGRLRLIPGQYRLAATAEGCNPYQSQFSVEAGQTNQVAVALETAAQSKGTVLGPDGKPAARVPVTMFYLGQSTRRSDSQGRFTLDSGRLSLGSQPGPAILVARDVARNLAAAAELDLDATNTVLRLEPGLVLAGRITDAQGKPLTNGTATLTFYTGTMSMSFGAPAHAGADGRFEIKGLPRSQHYSVVASAPGFGRSYRDLPIEDTSGQRIELETFQVPVADQRIAGVVVDADDKPVAGASINSYGSQNDRQPSLNARTDAKGRFAFDHVCEGSIQLSANWQRGDGYSYGNATVQAGDTNITLQLRDSGSVRDSSSSPVRLSGTVTDADGKPAPKVQLYLVSPFAGSMARTTDGQGRFRLNYETRSADEPQFQSVLVATDRSRNLAAVLELDAEATNATLQMEPGLALAGRVTDAQGKPIPNAEAQVMFHTEQMGVPFGSSVRADAEGKFEFKGLPRNRRYTVTVLVRKFGRDQHELAATDTTGTRAEMEPFQLSLADQQIAGIVTDSDDKPVAGASVNVSGAKQTPQNGTTDRKGRFAFKDIAAGDVQLYANNQKGGYASAVAQAGDTNVVLQLGASARYFSSSGSRKLTGTVTDPDGKPAPKTSVTLFPFNNGENPTDAEGRFKLYFDPEQYGSSQPPRVLIARDLARNLVAVLEVDNDATNADLRLEPGVSLSGRILEPQGKGIAGAEAFIMFFAGNYGSQLGQPVRADADGRYELKALPIDARYSLYASAKGFGRDTSKVDTSEVSTNSTGTRVLQLDPIELPVADQRIAGVVLDPNDKPVAQAYVNLSGPKQPNGNVQTDSKGRFTFNNVCAGQIDLYSYSRNGDDYTSIRVEAGDTNITLQLRASSSGRIVEARPVRLKGKPLPDLAVLGLTATDVPANQPVLVLLIDAEQRPSRRSLKVLTDQADALKDKHVAVIILQASAMADAAYAAWLQDAALPFPIARLKDTSEKGHAAWGAAALPWLILADKTHRVAAEGFATGELEAKLNELAK